MIAVLLASTWSVCVDPGHGGSDPGATGLYYTEKEANLDVGFWVKHYLEGAGLPGDTVIVGMTRTEDVYVSLYDRVYYANSMGFDRFVSVHHNAFDGSVQGTKTFCYTHGSSSSFDMRDSVQPRLLWAFGYNDRGADTADFYVLRNTTMPAILGEASFIDYRDGYDESWRFWSHWHRHDEREGFAYADGVCRHLGISSPVFPETYSISGTVSLSPPKSQEIGVYCYRDRSDTVISYRSLPGPGPFVIDSLAPDTYDLFFTSGDYNSCFVPDIPLNGDTAGLSVDLRGAQPDLIVDNLDPACLRSGTWSISEWSPLYYGLNYLWADGIGNRRLLFMPDFPQAGEYEVAVWFTPGANRATNAPLVVHHASGVDTFYVDQTSGGGAWLSLGMFPFDSGSGGHVELGNWGLLPDSSAVVIGDAVRFYSQVSAEESPRDISRIFFDQTHLSLVLPGDHVPVRVSVYDAGGRRVAGAELGPGITRWRPEPLRAGVYFLRLTSMGRARVYKFIVK